MMVYDPHTQQHQINGVWIDESYAELSEFKIFYGGLWPVYWVDIIDPMFPKDPHTGLHRKSGGHMQRDWFLSKSSMIAYLTRLKFKHPNASFEKY